MVGVGVGGRRVRRMKRERREEGLVFVSQGDVVLEEGFPYRCCDAEF